MGRRGPQPEPTASKLARGVTRPSRVNYETPMPRQRPPTMPRGMSPAAQTVWRHVVAEMPPSVIVAVDAYALRAYCEAVERYETAVAILNATSYLVEGYRGQLVRNPILAVIRSESDLKRQWARELGLTPSARAGLRMELPAATTYSIAAEIGQPRRLRIAGD